MKKFIQKIILFLSVLCHSAREFMKEHVEPSVKIMAQVKKLVDNPGLDILVNLTPNNVDNLVLINFRFWLSRAISLLELPIECLNKGTQNEAIICFVEYLRKLSPQHRNAIIAKTATTIAKYKAGLTDLKDSEIDTLVHLAVLKLKEGK